MKNVKRQHLDFDTWEKEALKDPEIRAEYERQQPEFALIQAMLDARIKKGVTQKEIARRMKTKQSVISRLETGNANPSVRFLKKLAKALHTTLEIRFIPRKV